MNSDADMWKEKISREAHNRLWEENARLRAELVQANLLIAKLTKSPLGANAVVSTSLDIPGKGKQPISLGIVQCPKCGQLMEVEK